MNKSPRFISGLLILILSYSVQVKVTAQQIVQPKAIDKSHMDLSVKPGDDFYLFANGNWLKNNPIPGGYSTWGSFAVLRAQNAEILRRILEDTQQNTNAPKGSPTQLLRDFYRAAMNTEEVEKASKNQLAPYFKQIDALKTKDQLAKLIGEFHKTVALQAAFIFYRYVDVDNPNSTWAIFNQGGFALPNRSHYVNEDAESIKIRNQYRQHIERMFRLLGDPETDAKTSAETVLKIETMLARNSLTAEEQRDSKLTFNRMSPAEMQKQFPHFNWKAYFAAMGLPTNQTVNVAALKFFSGLSEMSRQIPIKEWKTYLKWNVLTTNARFLSADFETENFDFFQKTLNGVTQMKPREQRVQAQVENYLGWELAREYVKKHFSPEAKSRMLVMVEDIKEAFRQRIKTLDWMSETTKQKALVKLDKITVNVGYPNKWRDFSGVDIKSSGYVANIVSVNRHTVEEDIKKLSEPIGRDEFGMTPQTVNAYYSQPENKIVFPAGILQPPFYHESFDDAVNYGAIGAVIAHEFTHAFDDQGSQFEGDGKLENWWTEEDLKKFKEKQKQVIEQYNEYTVLDGVNWNGTLTVGENIADLGGVSIAYDAFQMRQQKNGRQPDIEGLTPEQRFFIAWAQIWRGSRTPQAIRVQLNTPGATSHYPLRVVGPFSNHEGFIKAFDLKEGDKMVRPANKRIKIW
jgi:putative endopeptidase